MIENGAETFQDQLRPSKLRAKCGLAAVEERMCLLAMIRRLCKDPSKRARYLRHVIMQGFMQLTLHVVPFSGTPSKSQHLWPANRIFLFFAPCQQPKQHCAGSRLQIYIFLIGSHSKYYNGITFMILKVYCVCGLVARRWTLVGLMGKQPGSVLT